MEERFLPIGIQTFEDIRDRNAVYVDKTELVYRMVKTGKYYFLSRPRRFGKSLLVSTLRSYFEGRKDLFEGLAMAQLEKDWAQYPVLHFSLSLKRIVTIEDVGYLLDSLLRDFEKIYGVEPGTAKTQYGIRMKDLVLRAGAQTGQKVVLLIDEYDAPILDTMHDDKLMDDVRHQLRDFYSPIKDLDSKLQFVFITGISKFSQLSIFSELNNLKNISMLPEYSAICGISQEELEANFAPEIEAMAEKNGYSKAECIAELKKNYDGYHFSQDVQTDIYNPFSLLKAFSDLSFGSYWFLTGTPTFLTKMMLDSDFDYKALEEGVEVSIRTLENYRLTSSQPLPMLYQTGYVTIKDYDKEFRSFFLGVPNEEVKFGLYERLLPL